MRRLPRWSIHFLARASPHHRERGSQVEALQGPRHGSVDTFIDPSPAIKGAPRRTSRPGHRPLRPRVQPPATADERRPRQLVVRKRLRGVGPRVRARMRRYLSTSPRSSRSFSRATASSSLITMVSPSEGVRSETT